MAEDIENDEKEPNEPKQDRIGNEFREGSNPNPGGDIDTEGSLIPPYEGRTNGEQEGDDADD